MGLTFGTNGGDYAFEITIHRLKLLFTQGSGFAFE